MVALVGMLFNCDGKSPALRLVARIARDFPHNNIQEETRKGEFNFPTGMSGQTQRIEYESITFIVIDYGLELLNASYLQGSVSLGADLL